MFDLEEELKNLPDRPGVYIMHNSDGDVIYVGKAKILKNRVRQYFRKNSNHTAKVLAMVSNVAWFEYIVTFKGRQALPVYQGHDKRAVPEAFEGAQAPEGRREILRALRVGYYAQKYARACAEAV